MAPLQKSKSASTADQLQIQHFTHHHVLHKIYMTFDFNCDGCNTGGSGVRYRCSVCDFDLHEECATSPHRISSHLHPHHQLVLVNRPSDSHFCDVCRGFTNGLSYTCECPTCEFDLHPLCFQTPIANGVPSLTLDLGQPTTAVGVHHKRSNSQPVMPTTTTFGGYQVPNNGQPIMITHQQQHQQHQQQQQQQQQGMPTTYCGYQTTNNGQPIMINQQQQQQQQVIPTTMFGGYNGMNNNSQYTMVNNYQHQPLQAIPETAFGGYSAVNNNSQPMMVNHQLQQQHQGTSGMGYGGYNNGLNTNQQMMMIHQTQQNGMMPMMVHGGYNNNQNMINYNQQQQGTSSKYSKVGKVAANILSTSLIGIPLFNTKT